MLIGELYLPLDRLVAYYGREIDGVLRGVQLPFNFQLIGAPWHAAAIDRIVRDYEAALPPGGWPNWVLGNHDQSRIATRVGDAQARVAAMLLLTLRGTPTLYYGDELGMPDVPIPPDEVQDPLEKNEPGKGLGRDPRAHADAVGRHAERRLHRRARRGCGSPTTGARVNVARLSERHGSMLRLVRALTTLRRAHAALATGAYATVAVDDATLVYRRSFGPSTVLVALNFTNREVPLPDALKSASRVLLSTRGVVSAAMPDVLAADEGLIVE